MSDGCVQDNVGAEALDAALGSITAYGKMAVSATIQGVFQVND